MSGQFLDNIPIPIVTIVFAVLALAFYELGFRLGRWWQNRMPGEQEGPTGVLVGSLLALQAFLLAITMGMASDRFDARRGLVLAEANAIEKAYLQADYLPEPADAQLKELLREYIPLRIVANDPNQLADAIQGSEALQSQMWAIEAQFAADGYLSDLMSSLGESLTDIVNLHESRIAAGVYARVPQTIVVLLLFGSVLSLGMVGYGAGLTGKRSVLSAVILVVALGAVLTLVMDLDRPQEGLLKVSQQPLVDVQQRIGAPSTTP